MRRTPLLRLPYRMRHDFRPILSALRPPSCMAATPANAVGNEESSRRQRFRWLQKLAFAFAIALQHFLFFPANAKTLTVVLEEQNGSPAGTYLADLRAALTSLPKIEVDFVERHVPEATTPAALRAHDWDIAIVSASTLRQMDPKSTAAVFDFPFVFKSTEHTISYQQSAKGRAAFARLEEQGLTGLAYLNNGRSLLATPQPTIAFDQIRGKKVAVSSSEESSILSTFGANPVSIPIANYADALTRGAVDSATVRTVDNRTWANAELRYVLNNSIKADVAILLARTASWDALTSLERNVIQEAATRSSAQRDQIVLSTERALLAQTRNSRALVTLEGADSARGTERWIRTQSSSIQDDYRLLLKHLLESDSEQPPAPLNKPEPSSDSGMLLFATTRVRMEDASLNHGFGDGRAAQASCGRLLYSDQRIEKAEFTQLLDLTEGTEECVQYIRKATAKYPRLLVFVHGFNNSFDEALARAMTLRRAAGPGVAVILWSWPSRAGPIGHYRYDKESATGTSLIHLAELLSGIARTDSNGEPVTRVIAHSMGSWHLRGAIDMLAFKHSELTLSDVVLAAPDVPTDELKNSLDNFKKVAARVTLYACEQDVALAISKEMHGYPRAGTGGAEHILVDSKLDSVDVDPRLFSFNHGYVFEVTRVLNDFNAILMTGSDAERRGLTRQPKPPRHYWTFPNAKKFQRSSLGSSLKIYQ